MTTRVPMSGTWGASHETHSTDGAGSVGGSGRPGDSTQRSIGRPGEAAATGRTAVTRYWDPMMVLAAALPPVHAKMTRGAHYTACGLLVHPPNDAVLRCTTIAGRITCAACGRIVG